MTLTLALSLQDRVQIGDELEKLFTLQDRPLTKEKKALLVQELGDAELPMNAILAGIQKLMVEDLKNIKLSTIIHAAREFTEPVEREIVACDYCERTGFVCMKDEQGYEFSLACNCTNGARIYQSNNLVRWDGQDQMVSKGRILNRIR